MQINNLIILKLSVFSAFLMLSINVMHSQSSVKLNLGSLQLIADVDPIFQPVNYGSIEVNKSIVNDNWFVNGKVGFAKINGMDSQQWTSDKVGGGLVQPVYESVEFSWVPSHQTYYAFLNIGTSRQFTIIANKLKANLGLGLGSSYHNTSIDLRDDNDIPYPNVEVIGGGFDREFIVADYDDTYETKYAEGSNFTPHIYFRGGIAYQVSNRISIAIDVEYQRTNNDHLDGITHLTIDKESKGNDHVRLLSLGLGLSF